jgi:outer membrane immunogenic protein
MNRFTKVTAALLTGATAMAGAAQAGSLQDPIVETPVAAPAPAPVYSGDWTGFYTGLQLGYADVDGQGANDGSDNSYGFHAGYDYDFGSFVLGGELDYDKTDIDIGSGAGSVDSVARLKVKGGYDLGKTLIYGTAGVARADTSFGNETGPFAGIGVAYKVTDRYTIGAELLEHRFSDVGGTAGNDVDATTFTVRGSMRF